MTTLITDAKESRGLTVPEGLQPPTLTGSATYFRTY